MNKNLLLPAVQNFLKTHIHSNTQDIALKKSPFPEVTASELAIQLEGRQKAEKKLNTWFQKSKIYYPKSLSIEQASSEDTAKYKADLISQCSSVIDLTGGFGVDSYFFSKKVKRVAHCELNEDLSKIAQHNAKVLGADNIEFIAGDGVSFLQNQTENEFQCIYLDPSRRVKTRKVFMLQDCEPNIIGLQDKLFQKSTTILIKTAPLLDITLSLKQLNHVKEVHILSLNNDCKEVLFLLEKNNETEPLIKVAGLRKPQSYSFSFLPSQEKIASIAYSLPKRYIYEPDVGLLKAGCFKLIAERNALDKLHTNTHLYTSDRLQKEFPGKSFEIIQSIEYKYFKKNKNNWTANVVSKNFPIKAEEIRKKHKIKEGKNEFLFFCRGLNDQLLVIHAQRLA